MAKERLRFNISDDIALLREVCARNPYGDSSRWKEITENVVHATYKNFSTRAVKEHLEHLMALWAKGDKSNLRKSGTEDQYNEKESLLEQVYNLPKLLKHMKRFLPRECEIRQQIVHTGNVKFDLKQEDSIEKTDGESVAFDPDDEELQTIQTSSLLTPEVIVTKESSPVTPTNNTDIFQSGSKKRKPENLQLLLVKQDRDRALRERELALEENKLELEQKRLKLEQDKFELDKKQVEMKLQMDSENLRHRMAIENKQQNLIDLLLNNLLKK